MKRLLVFGAMILLMSTYFYSCRDTDKEMTEEEKVIQEMKDEGADIDVNDDGTKIKMETENKEVKIKKDDGDTKIKVKTENDDN